MMGQETMFKIRSMVIGISLMQSLLHVGAVGIVGTAAGKRPLVWGLDLGNDNIVMAMASRNGVDVVTNDVSGRQTPSAVYFAGDHRLIGEHSAGHAGSNPRNLINRIKFLLDDHRPSPYNIYGFKRRRGIPGDLSHPGTDSVGPSAAGGTRREGCTDPQSSPAEDQLHIPTEEESEQNRSQQRDGNKGDVDGDGQEDASDLKNESLEDDTNDDKSDSVENPILQRFLFCETRSPEEADQAGQVAIVEHMGQELELGASEAIAHLLGHCSEVVAREAGGDGVASSCVVASVPSHFSLRQRRAILDAASIVGVPMPAVIDEGTAVALAYGILKGGLPAAGAGPPLTVAFVDIGHSCTQVTLASFTASGLRMLGRGCAKDGGTAAGEAAIFDRVCSVISGEGIVVEGKAKSEFRLAAAVSSAMKTLSANKEARLNVDCIDGDKDVALTLTREEVETACGRVAAAVSSACMEALRAAQIQASDVSDVELLGGGSYIPVLRRAVESVFGEQRVRRTMSSSESVARGCALAAAQHSSVFKLRAFRIVDSLPRDLRLVWRYCPGNVDTSGSKKSDSRIGLAEFTGEVDVPAGTPIPWTTSVSVSVGVRERGAVHVHLMEGADRVASYQIDLNLPRGFDGIGGGKGGSENAEMKFFFRVDDAGVPSVQSARIEFEEKVTEFVEEPAPAPSSSKQPVRSTHPLQPEPAAPDDNPDAKTDDNSSDLEHDSRTEKETNAPEAEEISTRERNDEDAEKDGLKKDDTRGVQVQSRSEHLQDEAEGVNVAKGAGSQPGLQDVDENNTGENEGNLKDGETPSSSQDVEQPKHDGSDARLDDALEGDKHDGESESARDASAGNEGGDNADEKARLKREQEEAQQQQQQQQTDRPITMIKVPRVVTRVRSRPLRVEQTYTGLLEGPALEEARAKERALRAQDVAYKLAGEARNSLEDLVYASRSSLEPGDGELSPFAESTEAAAVLSLLEDTEEWIYDADGARDKAAFEKRAVVIRDKLSELQSRRQARSSLLEALEDADSAASEGDTLMEAARASLSGSQRRHAANELAAIRRFVADVRQELNDSIQQGEGGAALEYGSLVGRLPAQEADVRKKMESLHKAFAFARKEHS